MVEKGGKVQKYDEGFKVLNETKEEETIFFRCEAEKPDFGKRDKIGIFSAGKNRLD